jgi:hypothetical protein
MKIGIIEFLQGIVDQPDKDIEISQDEIIDLLWAESDDFTVQESTVSYSFVTGPWYTYNGTPTGYVGFCQAS